MSGLPTIHPTKQALDEDALPEFVGCERGTCQSCGRRKFLVRENTCRDCLYRDVIGRIALRAEDDR